MTAAPLENWGPWASSIEPAERLARLRGLAAFTHRQLGLKHPLVRALWRAESGEPEDLAAAACELERMPALDRRRLQGSYAAHLAERARQSAKGGRHGAM